MGPGELLLDVCATARTRLTLCAPFTKAGVISKILESTPRSAQIELFTRWRPEEVSAGVSDTGVLELLLDRDGVVLLCDRVHAKYMRGDDRALVGSANLTAAGLGWRASSNLELLVEISPDEPAVAELDRSLREESIPATAAIAEEIERVASLLPKPPRAPEEAQLAKVESSPHLWFPRLREPRDLYLAYSGPPERLSRASSTAAAADLSALELPPALDRDSFEEVVGTRLLQAPVVRALDKLLVEPQRFGAVRRFLGDLLGLDREEADYTWQTMMRWMLYFMSDRYARSVPSYSEILTLRSEGEV